MEGADIHTFGEALARFRTRAGLSQQKLADQLDKNRRAVAAWEAGEYLPKTKGNVLELARILKLNDEETTILLKVAGMDPSPLLWNVPHQRNRYFTGRDELFDQLDRHLAPPEHTVSVTTRRVALTQPHAIKGLGGIGKTQIAVEYAYRSRDLGRYTHTFWVNAASEETIIASFVAIADLLPSLAAHDETDQRKLMEAVKHWLEQCKERWLLIFDNADEVALVRDYLPKLGNGSVLLTTRANAVGSLATSIEIETMGFFEGTELLLRRAQRFEYASDEEINQAGNIVIALDHFPLALDQAGAYIEETQCTFEDYLDLYQTHRQAILAQRGMLSTDYPHSVATTWLLSFQKVQEANPAAAELLELCSFLAPDRIPEELLRDGAAYWPASLQQASVDPLMFQQLIADLLKFSLVKRLVEDHAISIHRLVQAVQKDRMERETQRQWAERVVRAIEVVFPNDPEELAAWPQCLRYLDQAQICNTLIEDYRLTFVEAASILNRTGHYLLVHALYTIAEPLLKRALSIREQQLGAMHPDTAVSLNNLAHLCKEQGRYSEAEPLLRRAVTISEQQLGPQHPQTATHLNNLASLYNAQGRYSEAEPLYQRALAIREQQLGAEHLDTATSLNNLALLYDTNGRYSEAEPLYQRALAIFEQQLGAMHPNTAQSLSNLAELYRAQGRYNEAEPLLKRALFIREQQLGAIHPDTATALNNLADLYELQGRYNEAEPLYQRALAIFEQRLGAMHPDTAISLSNLAELYRAQGRYNEAEPLLKRALSIYEKQLGPLHSNIAISLNNLAALYHDQGRNGEAEPLLKRALSIREQQLGAEHLNTATSLNNLGELYRRQGRYNEAEPLLKRALSIYEKQLGAEHPDTAASLSNLANLYQAQSRHSEAETLNRQALQILERQLAPKPLQIAYLLNALAFLCAEQAKYAEAELLYQRALQIGVQQLGSEHPDLAVVFNNLAEAYRKQGKYAEADPLYQRALRIGEQQLGPEHPNLAYPLHNLATLYREQGKHAEAKQLYQRALRIGEQQLGPEHPLTQSIRKNYALLLRAMESDEEAKNLEKDS